MTLLDRLNDGGEVFLTHTTVDGAAVLRVAIGAPATTREHVERVWALLGEAHDWLARDFEEQAAERRAAELREREAAEEQLRARREAEAAAAAATEAPVEPAAEEEPEQLVVPPVEVPAVETPAAWDESATQVAAQTDLHADPAAQPADGQD
jgi:aromatic-L-amino-acid decarboxylase